MACASPEVLLPCGSGSSAAVLAPAVLVEDASLLALRAARGRRYRSGGSGGGGGAATRADQSHIGGGGGGGKRGGGGDLRLNIAMGLACAPRRAKITASGGRQAARPVIRRCSATFKRGAT